MSVGFVCPHDKFNWDQVPAPGGFGVEIVGKCIDCGVKLSPQQVKALSAKKMAFDGAISQLRSSGQHEKAQAIELARDGISKIRDVARHYSKLMDAANEAQAAQLSLPALAETIPDSTWKALGLPPKDTVRATLEAMINPIEQLRALPAMPSATQEQEQHNDWIRGEVVDDATGQPIGGQPGGRGPGRDDRVAARDSNDLLEQLKNASHERQAQIRELLNGGGSPR